MISHDTRALCDKVESIFTAIIFRLFMMAAITKNTIISFFFILCLFDIIIHFLYA